MTVPQSIRRATTALARLLKPHTTSIAKRQAALHASASRTRLLTQDAVSADAYNPPKSVVESVFMFRLLLLAAAAFIVWRLLRGVRIHVERVQPPPPERYEPMARCAKCGTHLPAAALSRSGLCGRCAE
ncbi:MAG: hypothetical protein E6R07_10795 [Nevskiaceae bacterium]|nr:MAG: hypothetical protein E6R07_10795 [Nevskiaceae bacterium]